MEDNFFIAAEIEAAIEDSGGAAIGPAHNAKEALELVDRALDGAVLNIHLGRAETSLPVAQELANLGVPFVFYTSDPDHAEVRKCFPDAPIIDKGKPTKFLLQALAENMRGSG
ncbi:MAG: response regulator [Erythrobacter sp.]